MSMGVLMYSVCMYIYVHIGGIIYCRLTHSGQKKKHVDCTESLIYKLII